jgi:HTH-type transcriptional regulator/antitoxin HigA
MVPRTVRENQRLIRIARQLIDKGQSRTAEESALAELLAALIFQFEQDHYKPPKLRPHEILEAILQERGLKQQDLLDIFQDRSQISKVVAGKMSITPDQAVALGKRFKMNPSSFVEPPG